MLETALFGVKAHQTEPSFLLLLYEDFTNA